MSTSRRQKILALQQRERNNGDKRARLEALLVGKLTAKYGSSPEVNDEIGRKISSFVKAAKNVTERDLTNLERQIRDLTMSRPGTPSFESFYDPGLNANRRSSVMSGGGTQRGTPPTDSARGRPSSRAGQKKEGNKGDFTDLHDVNDRIVKLGVWGEEWKVLQASSLIQAEEREEHERERRRQERLRVKQQLDAQVRESRNRELSLRDEEREYVERQKREQEVWTSQQRAKERAAKQLHLTEKSSRDAQLAAAEQQHNKERLMKEEEDAREVARVQAALAGEKAQAAARKVKEKEALRALLSENERWRQVKEQQKRAEAEEDVRLMVEYKQKLDREEALREQQFANKLKRIGDLTNLAEKTRQKEQRMAQEMEARILGHQQAREQRERERERGEAEKRAAENESRRRALARQLKEKAQREAREMEEEKVYATRFRKEGEDAAAEQKEAAARKREREQQYQSQLLSQMKTSGNPRYNGVDDTEYFMSDVERRINARGLESATKDPLMMKKIKERVQFSKSRSQSRNQ